jgi:hypothetical protein
MQDNVRHICFLFINCSLLDLKKTGIIDDLQLKLCY